MIFLVQVRLRTKVPHTRRTIRPGVELMTFRSWQYISCHWDACSNHSAVSDFHQSFCLPYNCTHYTTVFLPPKCSHNPSLHFRKAEHVLTSTAVVQRTCRMRETIVQWMGRKNRSSGLGLGEKGNVWRFRTNVSGYWGFTKNQYSLIGIIKNTSIIASRTVMDKLSVTDYKNARMWT